LGDAYQFFPAQGRKALAEWTPYRSADDPPDRYHGVHPTNVPWEIYLACSTAEGIDATTYSLLCSRITLSGLYDLLEMQNVNRSWQDAMKRNAALTRK
jgi:hypothetical protein